MKPLKDFNLGFSADNPFPQGDPNTDPATRETKESNHSRENVNAHNILHSNTMPPRRSREKLRGDT